MPSNQGLQWHISRDSYNPFAKTCTTDLQLAKTLANQLAAVGKAVDDEDLITYIVSGLHPSYTPFITTFSFTTRYHVMTFEAFQSELLNFEALIASQQ